MERKSEERSPRNHFHTICIQKTSKNEIFESSKITFKKKAKSGIRKKKLDSPKKILFWGFFFGVDYSKLTFFLEEILGFFNDHFDSFFTDPCILGVF